MNEDYVIWWLDEAAYKLAEAFGAATADWPEYIQREFKSRGGRPGRGRLWVPLEFKFEGITWREGTPEFDEVGKDCGGIVIKREDAHHLAGWPGFITDDQLRLITPEPVTITPVPDSDVPYPFISRKAEIIYYLTQLDGEVRCKALGIEEKHYEDKRAALQWLVTLQLILGEFDAENAVAQEKLTELYKRMIHTSADEVEVEDAQEEVVGDPRFKIVPWHPSAYNRFFGFIARLEESIERMYREGSWMRGPYLAPTESLIEVIIDQILIALAWEYLPTFNEATPQWSSLGRGETKFVLITTQLTPHRQSYPVGFDVIGNAEGLENFYGPYKPVLDRLYSLYGRSSTALSYRRSNLDPAVLIKLVIAELFTYMASGSSRESHPAPPTRLYLAQRVQDAQIDARLAIGADIVLTPVITDDASVFATLNQILGLEEEPEPEPKPNDKFKDISPATLSKKQRLKAEQLGQGDILSAYIELDRTFVIMEKDTKLPYVWIERPGFWRHIREGEDMWRYSKYQR